MSLLIPGGLSPELQKLFRDIDAELRKVNGSLNVDFKGRRIINAGKAVHPNDYVTVLDVGEIISAKLGIRDIQAAKARAHQAGSGGGAGGGGGSQGGPIQGPFPLVPLYNGQSIVEAYAAANPAQLADSCQDTGGTWDFMDGVVAALRAADDRFGYNGKRGDTGDPSEDAVSYYHGDYALMNFGSNAVYVIDIIAGHCGTSPGPAWQDVTGSGGALGAWMPTR